MLCMGVILTASFYYPLCGFNCNSTILVVKINVAAFEAVLVEQL